MLNGEKEEEEKGEGLGREKEEEEGLSLPYTGFIFIFVFPLQQSIPKEQLMLSNATEAHTQAYFSISNFLSSQLMPLTTF